MRLTTRKRFYFQLYRWVIAILAGAWALSFIVRLFFQPDLWDWLQFAVPVVIIGLGFLWPEHWERL